MVANYKIDNNNNWTIEIDDSDNKLFATVEVAGTETKRQYDTPLVVDNWYYINMTWVFGGPTVSLKVNDQADTSSAKGTGIAGAGTGQSKVMFGSYSTSDSTRDFKGYLAFPIYYKHSTVLTTAERTSLYNYNTKSDTTKPFILGFAKLG
jgi:hypothetical protein